MVMGPFSPNELLNKFPADLAKLHLTFVTHDGISTFTSDNAKHLKSWWLLQTAKLINSGRDYWVVLNKRESTSIMDIATGLPVKKLSSCLFKGNLAMPLSAEDTRHAFNAEAETGKPLPPMKNVVFVDFV